MKQLLSEDSVSFTLEETALLLDECRNTILMMMEGTMEMAQLLATLGIDDDAPDKKDMH